MSGATLSPGSIPKYVIDLGYEVMASAYEPDREHFRSVSSNIIPISALHDAPYGHRGVTMVGVGQPTLHRDGDEVAAQTLGEGYAWQLAAPEFADKLVVPDSILEAANAQARVQSLVQLFVTEYAKNAAVAKDGVVAGMLQKGTLSAGSAQFFDGSYPGAPDANRKFIYDGKPWFAASGNAHPLKFATNAGAQGVNLTASLALSATNLDTAYQAMTTTNAIDERGQRIVIRPSKLIVGPALRTTAMQVLESQNLPGSANNDINPNRGLLSVVVNPFLTDDADAWWMATDDAGMIIADSGAPVLVTYRDESRKCTVLQASFRFGAAVRDWRGAYCANKATS